MAETGGGSAILGRGDGATEEVTIERHTGGGELEGSATEPFGVAGVKVFTCHPGGLVGLRDAILGVVDREFAGVHSVEHLAWERFIDINQVSLLEEAGGFDDAPEVGEEPAGDIDSGA